MDGTALAEKAYEWGREYEKAHSGDMQSRLLHLINAVNDVIGEMESEDLLRLALGDAVNVAVNGLTK